MSQHDFNIANQSFPATRVDLNNALQALATNSSGATAPATPYANQWWYDTDTSTLKLRNEADTAWLEFATVDQTTGDWTLAHGVIFGDNVKALFGTGSDLEIFHDGSDSIINDAGTGSLKLQTGDATKLTVTATGIQITGTALATTDTDTSNTGSVTLDFAANQNFVLTLTGNVTLANPTTEQVGQSGFIVFIQDGTGSRTVSLGTEYKTAGAVGLTLSTDASATDVVPYIVSAGGSILLGSPQLAFA